jgi:hypothetical protein
MDIIPVQGQVETGLEKESKSQRGQGLITMAAVPRAYWTSLFNLEAIKARNRLVLGLGLGLGLGLVLGVRVS